MAPTQSDSHCITINGSTYTVNRAESADLPRLVELLSDDILGSSRENADLAVYEAAFTEISAGLLQLTTNKKRADAHRFYDALGYTQSHFGYKKPLDWRGKTAATQPPV